MKDDDLSYKNARLENKILFWLIPEDGLKMKELSKNGQQSIEKALYKIKKMFTVLLYQIRTKDTNV